jgi:anti-sigma regulatory factor (Ser/Thr protein kinase)
MYFKLSKNYVINDIENWIKKISPNVTKNTLEDIKIVLGEVLQNIIRHGYKNDLNEENFIDIKCQQDQDRLTFILRDFAEPCKPDSFLNKEFIPNENGHMGLSIIRKLTDEFSIKPLEDGNETKLVFKIK